MSSILAAYEDEWYDEEEEEEEYIRKPKKKTKKGKKGTTHTQAQSPLTKQSAVSSPKSQNLSSNQNKEEELEEQETNEEHIKPLSLQELRLQRENEKKDLNSFVSSKEVKGIYFDMSQGIKLTLDQHREILAEELKREQEIFGIGGNFLLSQVRDILFDVFQVLEGRDIMSLGLCCKQLYTLVQSPVVWKRVTLKFSASYVLAPTPFATTTSDLLNHFSVIKKPLTNILLNETIFLCDGLSPSFSEEQLPWRRLGTLLESFRPSLTRIFERKVAPLQNKTYAPLAQKALVLANELMKEHPKISALLIGLAEVFGPKGDPTFITEVVTTKAFCALALRKDPGPVYGMLFNLRRSKLSITQNSQIEFAIAVLKMEMKQYSEAASSFVQCLEAGDIPPALIYPSLTKCIDEVSPESVLCSRCGKWLSKFLFANQPCFQERGKRDSNTNHHKKVVIPQEYQV